MLSLPHRLGWQSTIGCPVQPGNICRTFGNAEVRAFPIFSLRHCFPDVGQLTHITGIIALFLWDVNRRLPLRQLTPAKIGLQR